MTSKMKRLVLAALATVAMAGFVMAQDEPGPAPSGDAQQVLGDHAREPNFTDSAPGMSSSHSGSSHSETSSSSSSATFSVGAPASGDNPLASMLFGRHPHGATAHASGGGTSCDALKVGLCRACAVACPAGQAAQCRSGDMGFMTMQCPTESKCTCKPG